MGAGTLRLTLEAFTGHPREMSGANVAAFLAAALPAPLLLQAGRIAPWLFGPGLLLQAWWTWICFNALAWACDRILSGGSPGAAPLRAWLGSQLLERSAAFAAFAFAAAWIGLALRFYRSLGLPAALSVPVFALLGGLAAWLAAAALASVGLAAPGARGWRRVWKAALLLPLAYWADFLRAALLGLLLSGAPVVLVGLKHWSAGIFFAPLALSPLVTGAFYACYLVVLTRTLLRWVDGQDGPVAPGWRELWNPWR